MNKEEQLKQVRNSAEQLFSMAVRNLYPGVKFAGGMELDYGFCCDFEFEGDKASEKNFSLIEKEMQSLLEKTPELKGFEVPIAEAGKAFKEDGQKYLVDSVKQLKADKKVEKKVVCVCKSGEYINLCRNSENEGSFESFGVFRLIAVSGAYYNGSDKNTMLTRISVASFLSDKEMDEYFVAFEEAKKRDHKKIGQEMELFFFDESAPGMAYWLPKGLKIKLLLTDYWRKYHNKHGYLEVSTPQLNKKELWQTSGHWQHYKDDMFLIKAKGGEEWGIKPMNCPNAMTIYKFKIRSYKDLPLRISDMDLLHRNEISGTLNGLFRARSFTQDDSHNFVMEDQVFDEVKSIMSIVRDFYSVFGLLDNIKLYLSTRPEDYMGDIDTWEKAESDLRSSLSESGFDYGVKDGDGAFYGPKIDIHLTDAIGREWQCGTIQLDFQLPRKFNLEYIDKDGEAKVPVVLHRVVYGSIERFIGIITEHFAGHFPFWFAPTQVKIISINDKVLDYCDEIKNRLEIIELMEPVTNNSLRVEVDYRNESLDKKIRDAELERVPVIMIVGERDLVNREISIRTKQGKSTVKLSELESYIFDC